MRRTQFVLNLGKLTSTFRLVPWILVPLPFLAACRTPAPTSVPSVWHSPARQTDVLRRGLLISEDDARQLAAEIAAKLKKRYNADNVDFDSMYYDEGVFSVGVTEAATNGVFTVYLVRPWKKWHPGRTISFYEGHIQ